jgi:translocation and assembly module TamB
VTTRRRLLLTAAAVAGALLAAVLATGAWLVLTESGLRRAVAVLETVDALGLRIEGASGRLAGPLHVDSLELRAGRVSVNAEDLDVDWDVASLAFGRLDIDELHGASVQVAIAPSVAPPGEEPPRFMPRWLALHIGKLALGNLEIGLPDSTRLVYRDVRAAGQVTHVRIELDDVAADAGAWAASGRVGLVAGRPLRLTGELDWTVRADPALAGTLRARGDLGTLDLAAELRTPVEASAAVTLIDLDTALRWQAQVESTGVDLSPWVATPPVGPLTVRLHGQGSLQEFELNGTASGEGLPDGGLAIEGRLVHEGNALSADPLQLATQDGGTVVTTRGRLVLGDDPGLELRSEWTGLAWPLAGTPAVSSRRGWLELNGWNGFAFNLDAAVSTPAVPETSVTATGQLDSSGITVLQSTLSGAIGRARAKGHLGFGAARPWSLETTVEGLDLAAFRPGLDSDLAFGLEGSGTGLGPGADWAARVRGVHGQLRGHDLAGGAFVIAQSGHYEFREFGFQLGPAQVGIEGRYGRDTALRARLDVPDLGGLLDGAAGSVEVEAELRSAGEVRGDRPNLRIDLSARGRDLEFDGQRAAVLSADASIDLSDRESSWARLRGAGLEIGGQQVTALRLSLDGFAREHDLDLRLGVDERAASLTGTGRYVAGAYELTGERIESDAPRLNPYELEAPMKLHLRDGALELEQTCFVYAPRRLCVAAGWSGPQGWTASFSATAFPVEALRVDLPRRPGYRGRLDVEMHARGLPGEPWTAEGNGTLKDASLEYVTASGRMESLDLGTTLLRLDSLADRHTLFVTTEDSDALQLRAEATVGRSEGVPFSGSPLEGRLDLTTTRLGLLPLLVPEIDQADGTIRADLSLGGTPGAVVAGGTIVLEQGELDLYRTNLRLRQLQARITMRDRGLTLEGSGDAGEGSFQTGGTLEWRDGTLRGELTLKGDRLLVADVPEARVEASPDLAFSIHGKDIAVKGSVTIPTARIEPRQLVGAALPSADARLVGPDVEEDTDSEGYRVRTDVRMSLGKEVYVDVFGLRGRLEGSVLAQTRPDEVATASGELEIEDGKYEAYSKELEVERGRLLFAGGPIADPGVDLRAGKKVPGYEVGVVARGRLRRPELSLYSVPAMPQSQIASLLLVGRRLDSLDNSGRSALGGSRSDMATEGGALLAGQLGRYVGIDEVSLESEEEDEQSLVIGKYLSPRLYVSYGVSLTDAINTFKLRYTIGDQWVISVESGQESSADVEYTIDR